MRTFSISCRSGLKQTLHKLWPDQKRTARALHFEGLLGACLLVGFLRAHSDPQIPRKTDR